MDYRLIKTDTSSTADDFLLQNERQTDINLSSTSIQIVPSQVHNQTSIAWKHGSKSIVHFNVNTINAVLGPNGSFKSTLLRLLSGHGEFKSNCDVYVNRHYRQLPVFIDGALSTTEFSHLTVRQTLQYSFRFANSFFQMAEMDVFIDSLLNDWDIDKELLERKISQLEEGDRLQVAIVSQFTSLKRRPIIFILDHVFEHLDSLTVTRMLEQLKFLAKTSTPITVIFSAASFDSKLLISHCDRIIVLENHGRVLYAEDPSKVESFQREELQVENVTDENSAVKKILQMASVSSELSSTIAEKLFQKSLDELPNRTISFKKNFTFKRKCFNICDLATLVTRQISTFAFSNFFALNCFTLIMMFVLSKFFFSGKMAENNGCQSVEKRYKNVSDKEFMAFTEETLLVEENVGFLVFLALSSGYVVLITSVINLTENLAKFEVEHLNNWYSLGAWFWSNVFTSTITTFIFASITSISAFFATSQPLDALRLFEYILLTCIFLLYTFSIGQLIAFSMPKSSNLILTSTILFTSIFLLNDYFVKTSTLGAFFQSISEYLATKDFTHSLLANFYSDRCPDGSYSWLLDEYGIKHGRSYLGFALNRLCQNIVFLQAISLMIMYCRYGTLLRQCTMPLIRLLPSFAESDKHEKIIVSKSDNNENVYESVKSPEQLQVDSFLKSPPKISIQWQHLTVNDNQKPILCDLNGQLHFGEVHAVLGSPFEKSTLLKVLSGQLGNSDLNLTEESQVYLSKYVQMDVCFVDKNSLLSLHQNLTVEQCLGYISALRNCHQNASKMEVENIFEKMDLWNIYRKLIGQCSVGQQNMVAILASFLTPELPRLIFIEELFSGIDTAAQLKLILLLKNLAQQHNSTIIVSLSNTPILSVFDSVTILRRGGVCTYSGPITGIADSVEHFLQLSTPATETQTERPLEDNADVEHRSVSLTRTRLTFNSLCILLHRQLHTFFLQFNSKLTFPLTLYLLYGFLLRLAFPVEHITSASGCFDIWQPMSSMNAQKASLQSNIIFDFFAFILPLLFTALQSGLSFATVANRHFRKEYTSGLYSSGAFYCSISVEEVLLALSTTLLYSCIVSVYSYSHTVLLLLLGILAVQPLATIAAVVGSFKPTTTALLTVATLLGSMMLGGPFRPLTSLHDGLQLLASAVPSRFVFESNLIMQYGFGRCTAEEFQVVLFAKHIFDEDYWPNVAMLLGNAIAWRLIAMSVLLLKTKCTTKSCPSNVVDSSASFSNSIPLISGLDCNSSPNCTSFTLKMRQFSNAI